MINYTVNSSYMDNTKIITDTDKKESNFYKCIDITQHLLVDLCKKITNLKFMECSSIFKTQVVAYLIKILRMEYPEGWYYFNNFLKILNKIPEIFQQYYNMDIESVQKNINNLISQNLFHIKIENNPEVNEENINSSKNNINQESHHKSNDEITLKKPNNSPPPNNDFLESMIKHLKCVRDLLEMIKINCELFSKLKVIYKQINESVYVSNNSIDEEIFRELILDYERLINISYNSLADYANSEYLKNTFFPLMTQIADDINTMKSLLKAYRSCLNIDPINSISNLLTSKKNIEQLKEKYHNIYELKIYIFYVQFYLDNFNKCEILLKSYFEIKKLSLLQYINEQKETLSITNGIIKDEVFQFKNNLYIDNYMKNCFDENLDISYFIIFFEKKRFQDNLCLENGGAVWMKNIYFNQNRMFIDFDDDFGILSIFHTNNSDFKAILSEVGGVYKNYINSINFSSFIGDKENISLNNLKDSNTNITNTTFKSSSGKLENFTNNQRKSHSTYLSSVYNKHEINSKDLLVTHKISNYIFIGVKIKKKNVDKDLNLINELCKDFRFKFADLHLFKTIFY